MATIWSSIGSLANKVGFWGRQHAPQIMIIGGVAGGVTATVLACIASTKVKEVVDGAKEELEVIQSDEKTPEEDRKKARTKVYLRTTGKLAAMYAPAAGVGAASVASILGGAGILNKRNTSLAMGLAATTSSFKEYRNRLIEKFGEEGEAIDKELRYGTKLIEVKEKVTDKDGKTKTVKKQIEVIDKEKKGSNWDYVRVMDGLNPCWDTNVDLTMFYLRAQQSIYNDKLKANGYVFLNDVLKATGFPTTRVGQEVGWIYNPDDPNIDNYIDFGIHEVRVDDDGYKRVIMLEFNVDGSIINKVDWPDQEV